MSISRLSVLAVFLMMVLSAFVAIPTYNVGADGHGDGEDHDDGDHDDGGDGDHDHGDDGDHDDHGDHGDMDDDEPPFTQFNGKMVMESLGVWNVTGEGQFPKIGLMKCARI